MLTHGAAEDHHQIKQSAEGAVVTMNVAEHDFGQPLAFETLWQWLK